MTAVISVPDRLYGEVGHAFVLTAPDTEVDAAGIEAHCRERLANYKVPKRFHLRQELPMLPIGKIDRQTLIRGSRSADLAFRVGDVRVETGG